MKPSVNARSQMLRKQIGRGARFGFICGLFIALIEWAFSAPLRELSVTQLFAWLLSSLAEITITCTFTTIVGGVCGMVIGAISAE